MQAAVSGVGGQSGSASVSGWWVVLAVAVAGRVRVGQVSGQAVSVVGAAAGWDVADVGIGPAGVENVVGGGEA